MSWRLSRRDIRFLTPLYKMANSLGLVLLYDFDEAAILSPICGRLWAALLAVAATAGNFVLIWIRCKTLNWSVLLFIKCVNYILITLEIDLAVFFSAFWCAKEWSMLNHNFQLIDVKLNNRNKKERRILQNPCVHNFLFLASFIALEGYMSVVVIQEHGFGLELGKFLVTEIVHFMNFLLELLILNVALAFRIRYQDLNNSLKLDLFAKETKTKSFADLVREVGKTMMALGDNVNFFNRIFGWPLAFIFARIIVQILLSFHCVIVESKTKLNHEKFFATDIIRIVGAMISVISVIVSCGSAKKESEKMIVGCYRLQYNLPVESMVRRELMVLAMQVERNSAKFTAANLFEIDTSTILGILATTTTYFIVMVQLGGNSEQ